jgi:hypothetical protein
MITVTVLEARIWLACAVFLLVLGVALITMYLRGAQALRARKSRNPTRNHPAARRPARSEITLLRREYGNGPGAKTVPHAMRDTQEMPGPR